MSSRYAPVRVADFIARLEPRISRCRTSNALGAGRLARRSSLGTVVGPPCGFESSGCWSPRDVEVCRLCRLEPATQPCRVTGSSDGGRGYAAQPGCSRHDLELGKAPAMVYTRATFQMYRSAVLVGQHSPAVEFLLVDPSFTVEGLPDLLGVIGGTYGITGRGRCALYAEPPSPHLALLLVAGRGRSRCRSRCIRRRLRHLRTGARASRTRDQVRPNPGGTRKAARATGPDRLGSSGLCAREAILRPSDLTPVWRAYCHATAENVDLGVHRLRSAD